MKELFIKNIDIKTIEANGLYGEYEGITHKKILTHLSVVQAIKGNYDIRLDNGQTFSTGEGGVFIAPSHALQEITHHNGQNGAMQTHWVFIDAVINESFRFDEVFSFPVLLDKKYNSEIYRIIREIRYPQNYFKKAIEGYKLLEILANEGKAKATKLSTKSKIEKFVEEHYPENIKAQDIATHLSCSASQIFLYTKKYYGLSPANYINCIRLHQAETQLLYSNKSITEIAFAVGFSDSAYFSKLFKKSYGYSPLQHRLKYAPNK